MELRELTELETSELEKIIVSETDNGYKILLALIAIDLIDSRIYDSKLKYEDFIECIDDERYHKGYGFALMHIIEIWLIKIAKSNQEIVDEKRKKSIECLVVCFINTVCGISPGISGKKYRNMVNMYKETDIKIQEKIGKSITDCPEINYRYIVSCLEYMGLYRSPKSLDGTVDMSGIYYSDLFE